MAKRGMVRTTEAIPILMAPPLPLLFLSSSSKQQSWWVPYKKAHPVMVGYAWLRAGPGLVWGLAWLGLSLELFYVVFKVLFWLGGGAGLVSARG